MPPTSAKKFFCLYWGCTFYILLLAYLTSNSRSVMWQPCTFSIMMMSSSPLEPKKYTCMLTLPEDVIFGIFLYADFDSLISLLLTCKEVKNFISKRCELWSHLCRFYCRNFFAENGKYFGAFPTPKLPSDYLSFLSASLLS